MRSVNSESFIFGSDFVSFTEEKANTDPYMKLLLFTERTRRMRANCSIYLFQQVVGLN